MNDRRGVAYAVIEHPSKSYKDADGKVHTIRRFQLVSSSRQADKALGLSGRQLVKARKAARRVPRSALDGIIRD